MKEITVAANSLSTVCRLCLSKSAEMIDIFKYSSSMKSQIANVIMKCAPVKQILVRDGMPNFICRLCYTQLKKIHQFQMQALQSEKTLRRYIIQNLHASSKQTKIEYSTEKPENDLIHNSYEDITIKCESLEFDEMLDTDVNWKEKEFVSCNSEQIIKEESGCENSLIPTEYAFETVKILFNDDGGEISCEDRKNNIAETEIGENMVVNRKEEVPANCSSANKKSEIKCKPMNDSSLILRENIDDPVNTLISGDGNEIRCENTKRDIRIIECSDKREEGKKNILGNNEKRKNTTKKKKYQCDIIGYFTGHKRLHVKEKTWQCDVCNKYFFNSSQLNNHKLTHTGEKPYKCEICNKNFSKLCNLKYHNRTHTGEKPYQCDICNKRFARPDSLVAHKRTHTGAKLYQCEYCEKWFTRVNNLNVHKLLHTGEKRYQCDLCNKYFTRSNILKDHRRKHML